NSLEHLTVWKRIQSLFAPFRAAVKHLLNQCDKLIALSLRLGKFKDRDASNRGVTHPDTAPDGCFENDIVAKPLLQKLMNVAVELRCPVVVSQENACQAKVRVVTLTHFPYRSHEELKAFKIVARGEYRNDEPVRCD